MDCHFEQFITHLKQNIRLEDQDIKLLAEKIEFKKLKRKEFLLRPEDVSKHMRYIAQGCVRCYYLDRKSQEHNLQLGIENWWINDLHSFLTGRPSKMYLQAYEPTVLIQISKGNLEQLYQDIPQIAEFFRLKIQKAYISLQERTVENLSTDAHLRYIEFINHNRAIIQRFPQYMIASYLGMTPEFLSCLRRKHAKNS